MSEALRDRWGRYLVAPTDGGKPIGYTRVTTVAKTLDDGGGLIPWKATATIVGALRRPGLHARWEALLAEHPDPWYGNESSKATCKALVEECATAGGTSDRADVGTALHALTELYDRGTLDLSTLLPGARADLEAYAATMKTAGLITVSDLVECLIVLDHHKVAGTVDRIVRMPDGRHIIADVKTGTDLRYSWRSIAVQLAAYANADALYDQDTQTRRPMPDNLDRTTGIVIHLPAGEARCTLWTVDLVQGWRAFTASMWTRDWRKNDDLASPYAMPAPAHTPGLLAPLPAKAEINEGPMVDVSKLGTDFAALPAEAHAAVRQVAAEANAAGHSISLSDMPSQRRHDIGRALIDIAAMKSTPSGWDDETIRALVATVTGDLAVQQPAIPLGAAIGVMTLEQARTFADLAARYAATELVAAFRDDGTMHFVGLDAA